MSFDMKSIIVTNAKCSIQHLFMCTWTDENSLQGAIPVLVNNDCALRIFVMECLKQSPQSLQLSVGCF